MKHLIALFIFTLILNQAFGEGYMLLSPDK